jgi:RimJ/RimL family protein N-acetyltransferase
MIKTCDLIFRKVNSNDIKDLLSLRQNNWINTHNISFLNFEDQKDFFLKFKNCQSHPKNLLLVACNLKNKPVGIFYIKNIDYINRKADVSWSLYEKFRGKKIGNKLVKGGSNICFQILNLRRLNCEILYNNIPSIKCAIKSNYSQEGVKKESIYRFGSYLDSIIMGLIVEDFEPNPIENLKNSNFFKKIINIFFKIS